MNRTESFMTDHITSFGSTQLKGWGARRHEFGSRPERGRFSHVLGADDGEEPQLLGGAAAGRGREPEEALAAVLAEEGEAFDLDDAEAGVDDAFVVVPTQAHLVGVPQLRELRTASA
jgi:hypothetical protein